MQAPVYTIPRDFSPVPTSTPLAEIVNWWERLYGIPETWRKNHSIIRQPGKPDRPIRFGLLDTGVDENHPDLKGRIVASRDFTRSRIEAADFLGHGTWCASALVGNADGNGVQGLHPLGELVSGKCLGDSGSGTDDTIMRAADFCHGAGCDALSLSLGSPVPMSDRLAAFFEQLAKEGIRLYAAAGNDGGGLNWPAAYPFFVSVGAYDESGNITRYSSRDKNRMTCLGPGWGIGAAPGGGYVRSDGTSMACPHVAGIGEMAWIKHQNQGGNTDLNNVYDMKEHLRKFAKPTADGYGIVDPGKLFAEPLTPPVVPPPSEGDYAVVGGQKYKMVRV